MTEKRIRIRQQFSRFAFVTAVVLLLAACGKDNKLTQEDISITGTIRGIIIDGPWDVIVTQDSFNSSILLEYSESERNSITAELLPSGYLHLKISSWGNVGNKIFRAKVNAARLEKIEMSGAATLRTYGGFVDSHADILLSGASQLDGFSVSNDSWYPHYLNITLSGASIVKNLEYSDYNGNMNAKISGASELSFSGGTNNCTVDCSGASVCIGAGMIVNCSFTGSGASDFKTRDLLVTYLDINLLGASNALVYAANSINGKITGASTLKYIYSPPYINPSVSGVYADGASRVIRTKL